MKIQKKVFMLLLAFILIFVMLNFVSAEILIGQTEQIYNIGDEFNISFTLKPNQDISDFFIVWLKCNQNVIEIYRAAYSLEAGSEKVILVSTTLGNFLGSLAEGDCFVRAKYGVGESVSQYFELSRQIQTSLNLNGAVFLPGETVNVYGSARKNGKEVKEGFIEISLQKINFSLVNAVKNSQFNFSFIIPSNALSGSHEINVRVYEKDKSGAVINEGKFTEMISIRQIIKSIDIALSKQEISPEEELTYKIIVYDQANEEASTNAALTIYMPDGKTFEKKLVQTDKTHNFKTKSNYTAGHWKIEGKVEELQSAKTFFVREFEAVSFSLENQTLTLINIGNVPYKKQVEISIGNTKEIKEVKLGIGESKKFKLSAPDGTYRIAAGDGSTSQDFGNSFLTGRAISVEEIGKIVGGNSFIIVSIVLILLIGLVVLYLLRKILKERALRKGRGKFTQTTKQSASKPTLALAKKTAPTISSGLIDKGERQESSIVALHIKNAEEITISSEALATIDRVVYKAKEESGKVYSENDFKIVVFAPMLTKETNNVLRALKVAQTMQRMLNDYNKRYAQKIVFGIGVNVGELIVESKEGKFKFVSVSNVIGSTKRLANLANGDVVFSNAVRNQTAGKIKVEKIPNSELWRLGRIIDRSAHEEFIKKFMQKQTQSKDSLKRS